MGWTDDCRVTGFVQPGERGPWKVSEFEVGEHDIANLRYILDGRGCRPGKYTRLDHANRGVVMSDTTAEIRDMASLFYAHPRGRVLVNGLGLGCAVKGLLAIPEVESIDVVEIDEDVIRLTGPYYTADERVRIFHDDAFHIKWPRGTTWDFAWHDVWDSLNEDNLSDEEYAVPGTYARLHRMYARRVGRQRSWGFELLRSRRERERYSSW